MGKSIIVGLVIGVVVMTLLLGGGAYTWQKLVNVSIVPMEQLRTRNVRTEEKPAAQLAQSAPNNVKGVISPPSIIDVAPSNNPEYFRKQIATAGPSGSIKVPVRFRGVDPFYPDTAIEAGVTSTVKIEVTISETGEVINAKVTKSVPLLDDAALRAVKDWEYTPTKLDGVAVSVIMEVEVKFRFKS